MRVHQLLLYLPLISHPLIKASLPWMTYVWSIPFLVPKGYSIWSVWSRKSRTVCSIYWWHLYNWGLEREFIKKDICRKKKRTTTVCHSSYDLSFSKPHVEVSCIRASRKMKSWFATAWQYSCSESSQQYQGWEEHKPRRLPIQMIHPGCFLMNSSMKSRCTHLDCIC